MTLKDSRRILVWGLGISGKSVIALAHFWGLEAWGVDDKIEMGHVLPAGKFIASKDITFEWIQTQQFHQIVISPGVPKTNEIIAECLKQKIPVLGEMEFANQKCSIPIYAVTGTNGKSTTVHMLRDALRLLGKKPFLGGNVGIPFCDYYLDPHFSDYDCVVLEVSSFQCEGLVALKPKIAGILNLSESHMERYASLSEYALAKILLFKNMNSDDTVILPEFQQQFFYSFLNKIPPKVVYYGASEMAALDFSHARVVGKHNQENFSFVFKMLSEVFDPQEAREAVQTLIGRFEAIEHRLEPCGEYLETSFYNDSKSTNIKSALTAVESFSEYSPDFERWLIIGGKRRSSDFTFLNHLKDHPQITGFFCIGECFEECAKALATQNKKVYSVKNLENVFLSLKDQGIFPENKKRIIILTPAFPSYDQYKNFEERGKHFKKLVHVFINQK